MRSDGLQGWYTGARQLKTCVACRGRSHSIDFFFQSFFPRRPKKDGKKWVCIVDGCSKKGVGQGLCKSHSVQTCLVDGCRTKAVGRGKCQQHGAFGKCMFIDCSTWADKRGGYCKQHSAYIASSSSDSSASAVVGEFIFTQSDCAADEIVIVEPVASDGVDTDASSASDSFCQNLNKEEKVANEHEATVPNRSSGGGLQNGDASRGVGAAAGADAKVKENAARHDHAAAAQYSETRKNYNNIKAPVPLQKEARKKAKKARVGKGSAAAKGAKGLKGAGVHGARASFPASRPGTFSGGRLSLVDESVSAAASAGGGVGVGVGVTTVGPTFQPSSRPPARKAGPGRPRAGPRPSYFPPAGHLITKGPGMSGTLPPPHTHTTRVGSLLLSNRPQATSAKVC